LIIDEAHRVAKAVIDRSSGQIVSESIINNILRESRKYQMAVILATQRYIDVADPVRANTATKIFLQADGKDSLEEISAAVYNAKYAIAEKLPALPPFHAVVVDTFLRENGIALECELVPFFARSDIMLRIKEVEMLEKKLKEVEEAREVGERKVEAKAEARAEEKAREELAEPEMKVLQAMREDHVYVLSLIAKRSGYSKSRCSELLKRLIAKGYVEKVAIYSLVKRRPLIYFVPRDASQSAWHRILVTQIHMYLKKVGIASTVFNVKDKPDIECQIRNCRVAVEIETGKKHDFRKTVQMIEDRFAQGYGLVIVVNPSKEVKEKYEEKLAGLKQKYQGKLIITEYREFPRILKRLQ